jgi:hypothetical protein
MEIPDADHVLYSGDWRRCLASLEILTDRVLATIR